jgi:hypothetical protein
MTADVGTQGVSVVAAAAVEAEAVLAAPVPARDVMIPAVAAVATQGKRRDVALSRDMHPPPEDGVILLLYPSVVRSDRE